ncbi:hypothetical protein MXB_4759, partial [Myxobolus squamalis]
LGFKRVKCVKFYTPSLLRAEKMVVVKAARKISKYVANKRYMTEFVAMPEIGEKKKHHDKIIKIVGEIANLTLIELTQLNECLKITLKIPDFSAMMPSQPSGASSESPAVQDEPVPTKTKFFVKLEKYTAENKIRTIKLVREINPNLNLVDVLLLKLYLGKKIS